MDAQHALGPSPAHPVPLLLLLLDILDHKRLQQPPWRRDHPDALLGGRAHPRHFTGAHLFHLSEETLTYHLTGSGDTAKDWVEAFCYFALSLAVMMVWSILDRKRTEYTALHAWLRNAAICGGLHPARVRRSEGRADAVPTPRLGQLLKVWGEVSPMGATSEPLLETPCGRRLVG